MGLNFHLRIIKCVYNNYVINQPRTMFSHCGVVLEFESRGYQYHSTLD